MFYTKKRENILRKGKVSTTVNLKKKSRNQIKYCIYQENKGKKEVLLHENMETDHDSDACSSDGVEPDRMPEGGDA